MAQSRIRLTFTDDNSGANDNDGYKVYRNVGSDPCPGGVIDASNLLYTHNSPTTGTSVQYTDMTANAGTAYFYRVSFTRGTDETLSPNVVGPVDFPSADDLGYPNNVPSDQSGVTHFLGTEPLWHLNAEAEHLVLGNATYTGNVGNQADSWDFAIDGPGQYSHYNLSVMDYTAGGTQSAIPIVGYDPSLAQYWARRHGSNNNATALAAYFAPTVTNTGNHDSRICIMDEGTTEIMVFTAAPNNANIYGDTFGVNQSYHESWRSMATATHPGNNPKETHAYAWRWSTRSPWIDPNPPAWAVGKDSYYAGGNNWSTASFRIGGSSGVSDYSLTRSVSLPTVATSWKDRLHVAVSRVQGNGDQKVFIDGALVLDVTGLPTKSMLGRYWENGAAANTGQNEDYNVYPSIVSRSISTEPLYGSCNRAEQILMPVALSNVEILRAVAYVEEKFDGYLDTQSTYIGL